MARLLPSSRDASAADEAAPRVIGVDDEDADDLLAAMSSSTARELLAALHDEPAAPSELTDAVDTSLQNVQYHLGRLEDAGAVEVVDTVYSEKGREMTVYAPADRPLVVVAGDESATAGLRSMVADLLGAVGLLGVLSALVQALAAGFPFPFGGTGGAGGGAEGGAAIMEATTATPTPAAAGGGPLLLGELLAVLTAPGTLFFLGGATVLLAVVLARRR